MSIREHDDRPDAVRHADAGAEAWRASARAQQRTPGDHADFYALAGSLVETLTAIEDLAGVISRQVAGYPDTLGAEYVIYDDSRGTAAAVEPGVRLATAALLLGDVMRAAYLARDRANEYWSVIGHIGTEAAR